MHARILQTVLLSCFLFEYDYTEIKWRKPPDLHGFYRVTLAIFPLKYCPKGKVMLSVDNVVRHVTESSTFDNMTQFLIKGFIMFKPGENLNIFYEGNISLFIKNIPKSYIILNKVSETVPIVETHMTAAITKVAVTEPNIEVPVTEPADKTLNIISGISQSLMILLVPIILLIIVLKRWFKCCIR